MAECNDCKHESKIATLEQRDGMIVDSLIKSLSKETRDFIAHTNGMARMAWYLWGAMGSGLAMVGWRVLFGGH